MIKIFKEKAGVISNKPIWVCLESCYMYEHEWFIGLIWRVITQWRSDRNLVG